MNAIIREKNHLHNPLKWLVFLLILPLFISCSNEPQKKQEKRIITVSILPQKYFVEKIAGDRFQINVMIPPGASPESYDPTPRQISELSKSFIYFKIGYIAFERTWMDKFVHDIPELKVIDTSDGIPLIEEQADHHGHGLIEPHIWMSPANVKSIANSIYNALVSHDPQAREFYSKNHEDFISEIEEVDVNIKNLLTDLKSRSFIIYHPALSYFAADYNLNQIPIEMDGKEPSPRQIRILIDLAREKDIRVVFVQKQFDKSRAETIAKEIDGKIIFIDPLDYNWKDQLSDIAGKLASNLKEQ